MPNKPFKIEDFLAAPSAQPVAANIEPPAPAYLSEDFFAVALSLPLAADVESIRNKWAPVYQMPDSEKGTAEYDKNEARKQYYNKLHEHAARAQNIHNIWDAALTNGDHRAIHAWLAGNYNDLPTVHANFSPSDGGMNPLAALARKDKKPNLFTEQALTARILINNGVELIIPDHRNLLPADYALMSNNAHLATEVVMATLDHFASKYRGKMVEGDYIPAISGYFASEPDERVRMNSYANMIKNLRLIDEIVQARLQDPTDNLLPSMTQEAAEFWSNPLQNHSYATFEQIVEPNEQLTQIYQIAVEAAHRDNDVSAHTPIEQKLLSLGLLTKQEKTLDREDAINAVNAYQSAQRQAALRVAALRRG